MDTKNRTFDIFGTKWKLVYKDIVTHEDFKDSTLAGLTEYDQLKISLSTKTNKNKNRLQSEIELTKLHELIHAILDTGQYLECSQNEAFVEWLARCLYSLKKQNII